MACFTFGDGLLFLCVCLPVCPSAHWTNMNHHLDFELVKYIYKRWNLISANEWKNNKTKEVRQPQPILNNYKLVCGIR